MRKNTNFTISAVLEKLNSPLKILKLKIPKLKNNQILVKIIYSGVCGSQLMEISGKRGKDKWLPHLLGHEGVGIVKEIGKSVKKFQINDKVILTWISCKGKSCINPTYKTFNNRKINSGKLTTFGNYTITSENKLVKKPKNMPLEIAPLFGCCIQTGAGIVLNQIKPKKKDIIVIIGLGGIGFSSLITLLSLKMKNIVCVDNDFKKLKIAKKLGVRKIINSKNENVKKKIMKVLKKRSADYCIEAAGKSKTIELGISIIKDTGKLVFASHPNFNNKISLNPFELIKGKKIEGSWGGNCEPDRDIPRIYKLLKKNNTDYGFFFRKKYKLKDINNAIKDLKSGNVIRPIIEMDNKL